MGRLSVILRRRRIDSEPSAFELSEIGDFGSPSGSQKNAGNKRHCRFAAHERNSE
jgi:hypothetical protein